MRARLVIAALVVAVVVVGASFEAYETYLAPASGCPSTPSGTITRSQTTKAVFGGVTEFTISGQDRYPSALAVAPDGSVWSVEWGVPGVAHLYPGNGTLVEYAWKGYPKPSPAEFCTPPVSSSGIALWDGRVWGTDTFGSAIVGVNPSDGSNVLLNTTSKIQPYWLAVGPDGNLWFTSDNVSPPQYLGRVFPNMTVSPITLKGMGDDIPLQVTFVNSTLAFMAAINQSTNKTTGGCVCNGHIYAFNPSQVGSSVTPELIGGDFNLILPTSLAYSQGRVWVTQHGASAVVSYDLSTGLWTKYPTSRVPWTNTTLPYFIDANGNSVWFNEHYANKMAIIDAANGTMTELSASNPPASTYKGIQNDEYVALAGGRFWFASLTGNYIGFIDQSYRPSFQVALGGPDSATISPGGNATFALRVTGSWSAPMSVSASDSESYSSIPSQIHIAPSAPEVPAGVSSYRLGLEISVAKSTPAGNYTVDVTVTDGGIQQTAFLFLTVS